MKVSLPPALEEFVSSQVKSGEFDDASAVVGEALRVFRDARETMALQEMREAFMGVDYVGKKGEPTVRNRAVISELVKDHRATTKRR